MSGSLSPSIEPLAILGGKPSFAETLHVGRPNIPNRAGFLRRVEKLLDDRWLTNNGPLVQEFEARLCELLGIQHCIAVCNATVGLELATRAAGLRGEVIVPSYTFIATAHALQWQEISPVFADIDPATHNLNPSRIEALITPRTTGIIATHLWGRACPIEALAEIAGRRKLVLMFDAAHAFACSHGGRMIGGFGLAEVFSFHATKFLNSFEGGAITTNDAEFARRIRLMKNFGFAGYDNVIYVGTNGKMSEICAAMGLANLEVIDELITVNRRNYEAYQRGLSGIPGLRLLTFPASEKLNYQYVVIEVDESKAGLSRDELLQVLQAENVLARRYFWPGAHRMEPYRSLQPNAYLLLPETQRVANRVLVLPTGMALSAEDVGRVCALIRRSLEHAPLIHQTLAARPI